MAKTDNLSDFLIDIADAIRSKKGLTGPINPQNFSDEILSISGGGSAETSDLDYIKYYDDIEYINKGSSLPSEQEYEQIINEGYMILDYIFRGVIV